MDRFLLVGLVIFSIGIRTIEPLHLTQIAGDSASPKGKERV